MNAIASYTGVPASFDLYSVTSINNAMATLHNGRRIILYDPNLIYSIQNRDRNFWPAVSILAHEVAHHLAGHTLDGGGDSHRAELEADYYSGFVLQKLGAALSDAKYAMSELADEVASASHPSRSHRLTAIEQGWRAASEQRSQAATPPSPPDIQETDGFYPIIREEDLISGGDSPFEGCYYAPGFETLTVFSVDSGDFPEYVYTLQDSNGNRDTYALDVRNLNMALLGWVSTIMLPGRQIRVQVAACGAAGRSQLLRYVEPLQVGAR